MLQDVYARRHIKNIDYVVRVYACVPACMRERVRASVRACVCVRMCVCVCVCERERERERL